MAPEFEVVGKNKNALFTLKVYRGEGMALLAMNWRKGRPTDDFVGFAIEYKEPGGHQFYVLKNRLCFRTAHGAVDPNRKSTRLSPIQMFRWVHFPRNADLPGEFVYRVTPVFMNGQDELSYGESQEAAIELRSETYAGKLNVAFTRGFVSSQAFVDKYASQGPIATLLPAKADEGLDFTPTHPKAKEALPWMGFEAREAILALLDQANKEDRKAAVRVVAYDLNEPEVLSRLEKLGPRLRIIIDNDGSHRPATSAEHQAEKRLLESAGHANVKRQHMGKLQHNKTIIVDGPKVQAVLCGSTNFSWRAFFVQNNNAVVVRGKQAVKAFTAAFDTYWQHSDDVEAFGKAPPAKWMSLGLAGIDAGVTFSPHSAGNAELDKIAADIRKETSSSLFFSLAFLYQTEGAIKSAISEIARKNKVFSYGISDREVGGVDVQKPDGTVALVEPAALTGNVPEPFKSEPVGGSGVRMHHKFVVIDFDKPKPRVYLGSYNFSTAADRKNGENLLLIRDRRIAVSYVVEALRIFDHYHFRLLQQDAKKAQKELALHKPPRKPGEQPWWLEDYTEARKIRDRELFAG
jgi:phosphatidylserine/phosphatidylglycerophosphate/cardiolipin synthase-like enzyme